MVMNSKGQAALTDALYFLMIVSGLSTFLLFFAVNYGVLVKERIGLEHRSEYASSALKTLMYSSAPRLAGQRLEEATEVDYLLAAVKEDFADDGKFDDVNALVVNNIIGIMEPLADSFDYMFYIYLLEWEEFAFFMLYTGTWSWQELPRFEAEASKRETAVYLCKPSSLDKLEPLLTTVGIIYQANSRMQLLQLKEAGGRGWNPVPAQVNLAMWTATPLPKTPSGDIFDSSHLNCGKCFKKLVLKNPSCNPARTICETEWKPC